MSENIVTTENAPPADSPRRKRRVFGALTGFAGSALIAAGAAYALLMATATGTPEAIGTGKVSIVLADNGAGFSQAVSNMMPTDVVNRYVDVTNNGTVDGANLNLAVAASTANKLSTDATNGLRVTVSSCSGSWAPTTGVCTGTVTSVLSNTAVASLVGPMPVTAGVVPVGTVSHLRVSLSLPDQIETTVNGVAPANSIQSLTNTLTYTFSMTQRAGVTTNS